MRVRYADPLAIEETTVALLQRVLHRAARERASLAAGTRARHAELVEAATMFLSVHFAQPITLGDIASRLGVSVFHLCRVFHRATGATLHEYRHQLRLRWSREHMLSTTPGALVQCALDAGFSSHSHWGAAFRVTFGVTPRQVVAAEARRAAVSPLVGSEGYTVS